MPTRQRTYVLAVPRELREAVSAGWQARVRELGGIAEEPSASPHRKQIEADAAVLDKIRLRRAATLAAVSPSVGKAAEACELLWRRRRLHALEQATYFENASN